LRLLLDDPAYLRRQPGGHALALLLAARSAELAPIGSWLDALAEAGELPQPKAARLRSDVHLASTRLLRAGRPAEERLRPRRARGRPRAPPASPGPPRCSTSSGPPSRPRSPSASGSS